ncbi:plasmid recombination protein [Undibacterium sp. Di24W]|uniref:plasmid recombination protein n=1 Tax=Undibacterium sp. Di24W TaxID=3413033 RepID=UPI003BF3831F
MSTSYYLEVKPLSKKTTKSRSNDEVFLRALKHNMREILAEIGIRHGQRIDPVRTNLNVDLYSVGSSAVTAANVGNELISRSVKKIRRNASLGIEIVFSLGNGMNIDYEQFFRDCTEWAKEYYKVPLLSSIIHNDEMCPHCHVILIPIQDEKLSGSKLLGGMKETFGMRRDFYKTVAKKHGLAQQRFKARVQENRSSKVSVSDTIDTAISDALRSIFNMSDDVLTALIKGDKFSLIRLLNIRVPKGTFNKFLNSTLTGRERDA